MLTIGLGWILWWAQASNFELPAEDEAIEFMQKRAEKQWYKIPVARKFLVDAYFNDKYTADEKKYIAGLIRALENISEEFFRTSPWFEVNEAWTIAKMYGQIDSSILVKTNRLINDYPNLETVELVYVPGSYADFENHLAWRAIRNAGINTKIKRFGFIASGGTDFLMSWVERDLEDGAQIGVHAWTSTAHPESWNLPRTHEAHDEFTQYFSDMGISEDLYRWTIQNTRPETIHWLTQEERTNYWF